MSWEKAERIDIAEIKELPEVNYINLPGAKITFRRPNTHRSHPKVFCLPPWPSSGLVYYPLMKAIGGQIDLIAFDVPGWGGYSSVEGGKVDIDRHAQIIAAFIDSFNFTEYSLLGYSFGGALMQRLIRLNRVQPQKVIYVSTMHNGVQMFADNRRLIKLAKLGITLQIPRPILKFVMSKILLSSQYRSVPYASGGVDTLLCQRLIEEDMNCDPKRIIQDILELLGTELIQYNSGRYESLVIYAEHDEPFVKLGSNEIAEKLGTEPVLLEGTDHDHLFFQVNKAADIILNFLLA